MTEVRSCFCGSGFQVQNMLSVVLWQCLWPEIWWCLSA